MKKPNFSSNRKTRVYVAAAVCITTFALTLMPACADISMHPHENSVTDYKLIPPTKGEIYRDGIFIGYSDTTDNGYAMAVVQLKEDMIVDAILKEFTQLSIEKDFSRYDYEPAAYANSEMQRRYINSGSAQVNFVTGATVSSERYSQAIKRALLKAQKQKTQSVYFGGIFQGRSKSDNHGYAIAIVELQNDKIVDVQLKEVDENGEPKDLVSYPHEPLGKAYNQLRQMFIQKNSYDIDDFTGATRSSEKYKEAVKNALAKGETESHLPDYVDGTYTAPSDADSQGYCTASIMIENSQITGVILKEYDEHVSEKDFSVYTYEPSVYANKELPRVFIVAGSDQIDMVAGATNSSKKYQQAVKRALISASVSSLHSPGTRDSSITSGPIERRFK